MDDETPAGSATVDHAQRAGNDQSADQAAIPAVGKAEAGATAEVVVPEHDLAESALGAQVVSDCATELEQVPRETLVAMEAALERFHTRAEQYESVIRQMQRRIEDLQSDQVRELLKPVIVRLAAMHTEASAAEERASTREDDSTRKDFDLFVEEIETTLGLLDIESIGACALDEFEPARHAARRRIETDDPSLDRRVAKVIRQGFTYIGAERVFVPAIVSVYRHQSADHVATNEAARTSETTN